MNADDATDDRPRCASCGRSLTGAEPEGLCPRCLFASWMSTPDNDETPDDLPDDTCESYRPESAAAAPEGTSPHAGTASDTHYRLENRIGVGGSGEVWNAVQLSLGRHVAVKRLRIHDDGGDPRQAARRLDQFRREAVITGRLDHPNIVPVYDLGCDADGQPFLAMKLIEGTSWRDVLKRDADMPCGERIARHLPILIDICRAVSFAHSRGVIHRDLKPSQVIIGPYGEVLLTDWGLAVTFQRTDNGIALDTVGIPNPAGTVAFMAPEQTDPLPDRLGPWTDVWLLGGILYYIMTLTPPHDCHDAREAFARAAAGNVDPPDTRAPALPIPAELSAICMKALARDPAQRHASAEELSRELSQYVSSTASRAESASLAARAADLFAVSPDSYTDLQACDKMLQAACEAWPANADAAALRQDVLARMVDLATSRGDLGMAEMQVNRLDDPAIASPLRTAIHKARRGQKRRATRARILAAAIVILAAAALSLAGYAWNATVRGARIEAERLYARQRAELLASINELRGRETSLSEELARRIPHPTKLLYKDEAFGVTAEQKAELDEMISRSAPLAALRASLQEQGVPLEPEPFALVSARARLALHQAQTVPRGLRAYALAMSAATARPDDYRGRILLGIAAARAGFFTSATLHLRDAQLMASRQFTPIDPETREIAALYEQAHGLSRGALPPGAVVAESGTGRADDSCRELSGTWFDSTSRSCAPGVNTSLPGRGCSLPAIPPSRPARVTMAVPNNAPQHAFVYATWGQSANVGKAVYTVHHADGVTSICVCQAGFGPIEELPFRGNGNLWVPLGLFHFSPGTTAAVEIAAHAGSGQPDPKNDQRLYADAILFSPAPLQQATSMDPLEQGLRVTPPPPDAPAELRLPETHTGQFLVETHPLGMNHGCYHELSGPWSAAPPSLFAKSLAPGVTTSFKCGTRRIQTTSTAAQDAVAQFGLPRVEPGNYGVYVTWARTANAHPVIYVVRHADGVTSLTVSQRGSTVEGKAFDRWTCLGHFPFTGGGGQGVDLLVPATMQPVDPASPAIAYADAVLFSQSRPEAAIALDAAPAR